MFLGFTSLSILFPTILNVGSNGVVEENSGPKNVSGSILEEGELAWELT